MTVSEEKKDGTNRLIISDELTIYEAADRRQALLKGLEGEGDVQLDLSKATGCDAAGLQLLLAFRKSAERLGKSVRVTGVSPAVSEALSGAGLDPEAILGVNSK